MLPISLDFNHRWPLRNDYFAKPLNNFSNLLNTVTTCLHKNINRFSMALSDIDQHLSHMDDTYVTHIQYLSKCVPPPKYSDNTSSPKLSNPQQHLLSTDTHSQFIILCNDNTSAPCIFESRPRPSTSTMSDGHTTKPSYRNVVSSIPSSITYCSNSTYIICQLRRTSKDDSPHASTITDMYENGSASSVIRSVLLETFKTQPVPSTLQHAIDIREIFFLSLQGSSPTYSVRFSVLPPNATSASSQAASNYAKNGSPQSVALREFLYSMVFERWHTKSTSIPSATNISQEVINAIFFLVPPLNYPSYLPVAYLSGLPPSLFGRKVTHTSLLVSSIHEAVKPHLDPTVNSKLFHLEYFKQAFGLQAKPAHLFLKDQEEEVYLVHMSNNADLSVLSNILYSSNHIILTMGIPTTFFPIAPRPDSIATHRQNATYYGAIDRILADIRQKRTMLASLPTMIVPFIKHPFAAPTRDILLKNTNVISYSVFHLHNQHQQTKLFLKRPLKKAKPLQPFEVGSPPPSEIRSLHLYLTHRLLYLHCHQTP